MALSQRYVHPKLQKSVCFTVLIRKLPVSPPAVCSSRTSLGSVVVVYPPHLPQCVGCASVCGVWETHRQHRLVVTPVTSSLRDTPLSVSSTAVMIWSGEGQYVTVVAAHSHACDVQYQHSNYQFVLSCWLVSQQMRDAHTARGILVMLPDIVVSAPISTSACSQCP